MSATPSEYPILNFADQRDWSEWLESHQTSERGVWLRYAKKHSALKSITHAEALDVALCYGWIDGQAKIYDADSWLQKFTPRGKRSLWSKRNREHVDRLIAGGAMRPAGLAAIEAAKADGRWERAYDPPSSATVPADFAAALAAGGTAQEFFESLNSSQRFAFLFRIQTAVKPETRSRRIRQFVELLRSRKTL